MLEYPSSVRVVFVYKSLFLRLITKPLRYAFSPFILFYSLLDSVLDSPFSLQVQGGGALTLDVPKTTLLSRPLDMAFQGHHSQLHDVKVRITGMTSSRFQ